MHGTRSTTAHDPRTIHHRRIIGILCALAVLVPVACSGGERAADAGDEDTHEPAALEGYGVAEGGDTTAPAPPTDAELAKATGSEEALRPETVDWSGGSVPSGASIYALNCATCHGGGGRGDGQAAAALNPKPRDFTTGIFYIDGNADAVTGDPVDLARVILKGPGAFGGSEGMPGWEPTLSTDQVRDLVAYIYSFSGRSPNGA